MTLQPNTYHLDLRWPDDFLLLKIVQAMATGRGVRRRQYKGNAAVQETCDSRREQIKAAVEFVHDKDCISHDSLNPPEPSR